MMHAQRSLGFHLGSLSDWIRSGRIGLDRIGSDQLGSARIGSDDIQIS